MNKIQGTGLTNAHVRIFARSGFAIDSNLFSFVTLKKMAEGIDPFWEKLLRPHKLKVAKQLCPR